MKHLVVVALALATVTLSPTAVSAALAEHEAVDTCRPPQLERLYDEQGFSLRLALDLSGCDWWDGYPVQLEALLMRHQGDDGYGAGSVVVCGVSPTDGRPRRRQETEPCEIDVAIGHPAVEVARYHGEVRYPWRDGEQLISFDTTCTSGAGQAWCHDDGADE